MRAVCAYLLTAATSGLICATHDSESRVVSCPVACRDCVSAARTHKATHARTHTCTHTRARRRCRSPSRQPSARGQGAPPHWASILRLPTFAQGLSSPRPTSTLGVNASTTVHLHRDWAHPLPTSAPGLRRCRNCTSAPGLRRCPGSITSFMPCRHLHWELGAHCPRRHWECAASVAHACIGTGSPPAADSHLRLDCVHAVPHLHRDWARPLPTSAPGLRSATAHICTGTGLQPLPASLLIPHWDWAHPLYHDVADTSPLHGDWACCRPGLALGAWAHGRTAAHICARS
jgi:hypothetical protein